MVVGDRQRSNWSTVRPDVIQHQNSFLQLNHKIDEPKPKSNSQLKLLQYWSSMSPVTRGLLLGILTGCLLLSVALALWLTKTLAKSTTAIIITTTASSATTVTFAPFGIYALTIPTCATWNQTGITIAGNQNGTAGTDLGSLMNPVSIFVDNNDTLFIADRDNNRVVKYYPNSITGIIVAGNNTPGNDSNLLNSPKGVAVDESGAVVVADSGNYRIENFIIGSTTGITLFSEISGSPLGQMRDLHIDVNNNIYVTDSDYNQVVKYTPYSPIGIVLAGGNLPGSANDQLSNPYGNFVDGNNTLYVADSNNQRVMKYLPGSITGTIVAGINSTAGVSLNLLSGPEAIIVDNNGYIYIADEGNNRIVMWTTDYSVGGVCVVGCTGTTGSAANQFNYPRDLKFDKDGNLYVSDKGNNRVQKFSIQLPTSPCVSSG